MVEIPEGQADGVIRQAEMQATTGAPPLVGAERIILGNLLAAASDGTLVWERLREGIDIARLCTSAPPGSTTALLRYKPGARLERHEHTGFEHLYILAGSQTDDAGEHHAGALLIHRPGTNHAVTSKNGCLVLAIWERPVRFL